MGERRDGAGGPCASVVTVHRLRTGDHGMYMHFNSQAINHVDKPVSTNELVKCIKKEACK